MKLHIELRFPWHIEIGWLKGMPSWGASCRMISLSIVTSNQFAANYVCLTTNELSKCLYLIQMKVSYFSSCILILCVRVCVLPGLNFRASDKTLDEMENIMWRKIERVREKKEKKKRQSLEWFYELINEWVELNA